MPQRIAPAPSRLASVPPTATVRMTGRALQARRLRIWAKNPNCARCGKLTAYPHGFELDHIVPLFMGGADTDANCQVLCNGDSGCHATKTAEDARR